MTNKFVSLISVCDFKGGSQPPKKEWSNVCVEGYVRMLQIRDYTQGRNESEYVKIKKNMNFCTEEDILIARYGASIGKIVTGLAGTYNVALIKAIPDEKYLLKKYLYFYLKSNIFQRFIKSVGSRAAQAGFNKEDLKKAELYLPSLTIQKRIVEALEKVNFIIEKRQTQIKALDELAHSVFLEMFGDPILNTRELPNEFLSLFIDFLTSGSRGWAKYFADEGQYFITIKNVKDGKLVFNNTTFVNPPVTQEAIRTKVRENDLLISITADLGRTAVVDKKTASFGGYINQHLSLVRLNEKVNPFYISAFLESKAGKVQFEKLNQNGVKAGLNFDSIRSLKIMLPPLEEQNDFADKIARIKLHKNILQRSLNEMQSLHNSLLQEAFQGELF